jgi:cytochrome P450
MNPGISAPALRSLEDLPGPRGWPLLGNVLQVKFSRIHRDMEAWSREYGPVFFVKLGPTPVLVVADHETVVAVLRDRPDVFQRASKLREVSEEMGGLPGLFSSEGQAWRDQRRMVMASFAPGHVRAYFASLMKVTQRLRARWHKASVDGASIDLQADLKRFAVDAIAGLAFGTEVNSLDSGDDPIHRHLDIILAGTYRRVMATVPYWRCVRLPADRQLDRSVAAFKTAIAGFIAQARARMQADPSLRDNPRNLLEAMIAAADQGDGVVDDRNVAGNVSTMLLAGEDTTANTLAWLIYLMMRNPEALKRAQDEVRRLAPASAQFDHEQLGKLEYLEACISEAMRLKPVAPFLGVEALCDTIVAGVRVPAGTLVWCVMRHDSVHERYFPNAASFDPQRWLSGPDKRVSMPFGAGPRICPGRYLALLEIKMAMAMLLGSFEIEDVATPDGREAQEVMDFTMNPVALRMRLRHIHQP